MLAVDAEQSSRLRLIALRALKCPRDHASFANIAWIIMRHQNLHRVFGESGRRIQLLSMRIVQKEFIS